MTSSHFGAKHLAGACFLGFMMPLTASGQVVFTWSENADGVSMTASGSIDTDQLISVACETWGGYGHQSADTDIIGDTEISQPDTCFEFSPGTDYTPWQAGNPFDSDFFAYSSTSISTPFHTYTRDDQNDIFPGLGVLGSDLSGGTWTPQGGWLADGETLASLGLNPGTYTVTDESTGASITFAIGTASNTQDIPTVPLAGLILGVLAIVRISHARLSRA